MAVDSTHRPLRLEANPTFRGKVSLPTPEGIVDVGFEFKHVRKSLLKDFIEDQQGKTDTETIMACATNWYDVDGEFTKANIDLFCDQYHAAGRVTFLSYLEQLTKAKEGN